RRLGRLRLRRLLRRRAGGHLLPQPPGHGRLDGARRGLDELAHLLELGEHGLALNAELLRELMYAGFACHCTPQSEAARGTPAATSILHLKPDHVSDFIVYSCRSSCPCCRGR